MNREEALEEIVKDLCETDENVRKIATKYLSDFEVYGDSWGVPTLDEVVQTLVNHLVSRVEVSDF
jgi:hypothetical protein